MAANLRVFISYSSRDADIVTRLRRALADAGVNVWLDHEQLTPGTRNWQVKVREGIAQATHVIYAASETAALSEYVFDEISIARSKGKLVIPFWVRGGEWHDCVPLGFGATQRIDGRDANYQAGVRQLLPLLGVAETLAPSQPARPQPAAPQPIITPPKPSYPLPDVPAQLASLGYRGVNPRGTPAILPPLVSVAAGPAEGFLMGSDKTRDKEAFDDETPQRRVELAAFQIGTYPVTVAEYALAVRAGVVPEPPTVGVTWQTQLQRLDHPVVCVSWQDATAYVAWLREVTGQNGWRLPSEAQWEKAARWDAARGVSRRYPWGDRFDQQRCNIYESGIGATTPVGSYPANDRQRSGASPCGAEEMAGNVWEWTSSLFKPYPYTKSDGREDQNSTGNRTLRGGSWDNNARLARAAYRNDFGPDVRNDLIGVRVALARVSAGS